MNRHENRFLSRLVAAKRQFNLTNSLALCDEIHAAEAKGYVLSLSEDRHWVELTIMIESASQQLANTRG